ncbi:MAG TPA: hypothetical protein VFS29_06220 [Motilibacteraceae bacterium]|nr:hypothetical protein [Motilibacteraceae bacterium]
MTDLPAVPGADVPDDGPDVHALAAALRADSADVATFTRVLTATLGDALPQGMVDVERDRSLADRLAGRDGTPVAVHVHGQDRQLSLTQGKRGPEAEVRQVVRGVVISRRQVGVDEWIGALAAELSALAARDAAARVALARLLGAG